MVLWMANFGIELSCKLLFRELSFLFLRIANFGI